jgi:MFS family permease
MTTPSTMAGGYVKSARSIGDLDRPKVTVATFPDYLSAQRAVDYLSDRRFPVERVSIVGTDLRLVEQVVGRFGRLRATLAGLGSGAWFGLLIGLLLGIFTDTATGWLGVILIAIAIGAVWGAIFGMIAHAVTGGQRDFASISTLAANQYAIMVDADHADTARDMLASAPK